MDEAHEAGDPQQQAEPAVPRKQSQLAAMAAAETIQGFQPQPEGDEQQMAEPVPGPMLNKTTKLVALECPQVRL